MTTAEPFPASLALPTLVVGAGEAGLTLARDLTSVSSFGLLPVGFLDDDPGRHEAVPSQMPLLGSLDDLSTVLEATGAQVVVIAIPSLDGGRRRELATIAARHGAAVRHLPPFLASLQREIVGTDMRALQIGALIGRQELHVTSRATVGVATGRRVLVTGAGGSIGSELCRQISACQPSALAMLDHDESNLHRLQLEVAGEANMDAEELVVADIRDAERIHQVFSEFRPEVVFHAAALKHLPALERHPCEGVKSNVLGTENVVAAAVEHEVGTFVLISTDKAADPTSVLGATKRLAEMVLTLPHPPATTLCAVRFGNVLGSRGSLLHVLREQLASGRPVTVTDENVSRFFMTIEEAVGLVLEAARMADDGGTYVLDMGEPVRIVELVQNFARLLDIRDVQIRFTGLRPGEKLTEDLFGQDERVVPTDHPRISMAPPIAPRAGFRAALRDLYAASAHNRPGEVTTLLANLVPGYRPAPRLVPALPERALYPDDY